MNSSVLGFIIFHRDMLVIPNLNYAIFLRYSISFISLRYTGFRLLLSSRWLLPSNSRWNDLLKVARGWYLTISGSYFFSFFLLAKVKMLVLLWCTFS